MLDPTVLYHLVGREAYAYAAAHDREEQRKIDKARADRMEVLNRPEADLE